MGGTAAAEAPESYRRLWNDARYEAAYREEH